MVIFIPIEAKSQNQKLNLHPCIPLTVPLLQKSSGNSKFLILQRFQQGELGVYFLLNSASLLSKVNFL